MAVVLRDVMLVLLTEGPPPGRKWRIGSPHPSTKIIPATLHRTHTLRFSRWDGAGVVTSIHHALHSTIPWTGNSPHLNYSEVMLASIHPIHFHQRERERSHPAFQISTCHCHSTSRRTMATTDRTPSRGDKLHAMPTASGPQPPDLMAAVM